MSAKSRSKRRRSSPGSVQKANGILHPRVQQVGPQHFGIVCVDVGKAKSEWMLCDFYGKVFIEPTEVVHTRCGFDLAIVQLRQTLDKHRIRDQVVAIEPRATIIFPSKGPSRRQDSKRESCIPLPPNNSVRRPTQATRQTPPIWTPYSVPR